MIEPFVIIEGIGYKVNDWIRDKSLVDTNEPSVIVSVFEDLSEKHVILRSPYLEHELMTLTLFIERVKLKMLEKVEKPKFYLGQELMNRFTKRSIEIKDVPRIENEKEGEYVYYIMSFTPTYGSNYECMTESGIESFYESEGVDEV